MADIEINTVDRLGSNLFSHPEAHAAEPIREELNQPGSFACTIPNSDPNIANVQEWARELQVWRNGSLRWQGPITAKEYDEGKDLWTVHAQDPLAYFKGLHVGRAGRQNWLANGSFDEGNLNGWSAQGVTANVVTAWGALPGTTYQANLYQAGAGQDTFLQQHVTVPGGTYWTLSAWFHIRTDSQWVGPAVDGRGLYVERRNPDTNAVEDVQFFAITDDTPRGIFQRATVNMWSPPGRNSEFWIRLYATRCTSATGSPQGSIIWDNVQLVAPESLSYTHVDLAEIVNGLVSHAQDPTFAKTYLGIDTYTPGSVPNPTGVLMDRYYQFAEHQNVFDELTSFTEAGLCDIQCTLSWDAVNQKAVRHVRVWSPQQGQTRTNVLELDAEDSVRKLDSIEMDGTKTVTTSIVYGEGSGPDKEENWASDTSATDDVVIEELYNPPTGTHYDLFRAIAQQRVAKLHNVAAVPALVLSPNMTDQCNVGDIFPTLVDLNGAWSINSNYRVIMTELDLDTDQLTVQVVGA